MHDNNYSVVSNIKLGKYHFVGFATALGKPGISLGWRY
jgi:hypothetical protein